MGVRKENKIIINGNKTHNFKRKIFILGVLIIVAVLIIRHLTIIRIANKNLDEQASKFQSLNEQTIFSIDKIYLYSSAGAIENKETRPVWNLNLYQYTDIAIYINNHSSDNLNYENSIKELTIDNIKFTENENRIGDIGLYYKNINDFGKCIFEKRLAEKNVSTLKYAESQKQNVQQNVAENQNQTSENNNAENQIDAQNTVQNKQEMQKKIENEIKNVQQEMNTLDEQRKQIIVEVQKEKLTDRLDYTVLNDGDIDYTKPQIYADCSNPITLEYINKDIKENQIISDTNSDIVYDGNLLRRSGVVLSDIACTLSFNILITNYYNKKYTASVYIDIPLEDTATGNSIYNGKLVKKLENTNLVKFFRLE